VKGEEDFEKNEEVEEIEDTRMREFWRFIFLQNTKPSLFEGTKKLYLR